MTGNVQPRRQGVLTGRRLGPRPLPVHLAAAAMTWMSSRAAWHVWKRGSIAWKGDLTQTAAALKESLDAADPKALDAAFEREIRTRLNAFVTGVLAYRRHPYVRMLADPPSVFESGAMRLLDYGATDEAAHEGMPVLIVPSLINRAYVLDLSEKKSLLRFFATRGLRPLLVDWGRPGPAERNYTLTDYIAGVLESALDKTIEITGRKPAVLGYCMGGNLALALAARRSEDVTGLALLAMPWDFHAGRTAQSQVVVAAGGPLGPVLDRLGELPVDILQAMFSSLDPMSAARKFCAFAALAATPTNQTRVEEFIALEDWLNDGVPLVSGVARECLAGWYGGNEPARGLWRIAAQFIDPAQVHCPALVVVPAHDRIVPPESADAVTARLPEGERMTPPLGHIGMVVGGRARTELWEPLASWLELLPSPQAKSARRARKPRKGAGNGKTRGATF
ncbi:MAG: alpha/beta fold hydrolase [Alphaproteobacteria bacterium]